MSRKYSRERQNRQEKVWKEPTHARGGTEALGLWNLVFRNDQVSSVLNRNVFRIKVKAELVASFREALPKLRFMILGYKFHFKQGAAAFCALNGLQQVEGLAIYRTVKAEAETKLPMLLRRMMAQPLRYRQEWDEARGEAVGVYSLSYNFPEVLKVDPAPDNAKVGEGRQAKGKK